MGMMLDISNYKIKQYNEGIGKADMQGIGHRQGHAAGRTARTARKAARKDGRTEPQNALTR